MRIDCDLRKLGFCARAEIEHVIATIFEPNGRSEISLYLILVVLQSYRMLGLR